MKITEEQAKAIAHAIYDDIKEFISRNQEEYKQWLKEKSNYNESVA